MRSSQQNGTGGNEGQAFAVMRDMVDEIRTLNAENKQLCAEIAKLVEAINNMPETMIVHLQEQFYQEVGKSGWAIAKWLIGSLMLWLAYMFAPWDRIK